jgi:outer membrane cobalamin receptor
MKALTAPLILALFGCGPAVNQSGSNLGAPGTFLITAEQIEKSGAHTAWQVLKQNAPMLTLREDRSGRPTSMGRRGRSSFLLDEAPMIMLDGVRVPDFHSLETIEAESIMTILIYDGVEGTTYYGTNAVSGVIVIKTKDGRPS